MQLSQKQNSFSRVFTDFLEIYIKFWIFWKKKNGPDKFCIFEITDSENGVR